MEVSKFRLIQNIISTYFFPTMLFVSRRWDKQKMNMWLSTLVIMYNCLYTIFLPITF